MVNTSQVSDLQRAKDLARQGAHQLAVERLKHSDGTDRYRAVCKDCDYKSDFEDGTLVSYDILSHARTTLPPPPKPSVGVTASEGESVIEVQAERTPEPDLSLETEYSEEHRKLIPPYRRFEDYIPRKMDGSTDYATVKRHALKGDNILLISETGAGKNHLAEALGAELRVPLISLSMSAGITEEALIGLTAPVETTEGQKFAWVDGYFTDFYRLAASGKRCILVLDELNAAPHGITFVLHQPTDFRRTLVIPEHGRDTVRDEKHLVIIIGTMNPDYRGTKPLNEALENRFKCKLTLDYDRDVEYRLLKREGVGTDKALKVLKLAEALRKSYREGDLDKPMGTRTLIDYADNVKLDGEAIARHIFLNNYHADQREAVRTAMSLHLDGTQTSASSAKVQL